MIGEDDAGGGGAGTGGGGWTGGADGEGASLVGRASDEAAAGGEAGAGEGGVATVEGLAPLVPSAAGAKGDSGGAGWSKKRAASSAVTEPLPPEGLSELPVFPGAKKNKPAAAAGDAAAPFDAESGEGTATEGDTSVVTPPVNTGGVPLIGGGEDVGKPGACSS